MTSQLKTLLLLTLLSGIILAIGSALGGQNGVIIALVFALIMNVGSYWFSSSIVLSMYKAKELSEVEAPKLHSMLKELAQNANIPTPKLYFVNEQAPNAFATGRNPENAVVAVTDGLMRYLSEDEIKGVLAHEVAHIANRDILIQSVASVLGTAIMALANILKFGAIFGSGSNSENKANPLAMIGIAILAPVAAMLIQMAISRSREYLADASGARYANNPEGLANALTKLSSYNKQIPMQANPTTESMFIIKPFSRAEMSNLFSTHPPIEERINRLRQMNIYGNN